MSNIIKKFDDFQQMNEEVFSTLTSSLGKLIGKGKNVISGKSNKAFKLKTDDESMGRKILTATRGVSSDPNTSDAHDRVHNPANNWYYFFAKIDGNIYKVDAVNHLANAGSSENEYTVSILKENEIKGERPDGDGPDVGGPIKKPIDPEEPGEKGTSNDGDDTSKPESPEEPKPKKTDDGSIYPIMIKNLTALRDLLKNYVYIKIGEETVKFDKESYEEKKEVTKEDSETPETPNKEEGEKEEINISSDDKKSKIREKYLELFAKWKNQQKKDGKKNMDPGQGTRRRLQKKAAELVEYSELLSEWKEKQKKDGKTNIEPGEGTRKRLKKRALEIVNASNESLEFNYIDDYLSFCLNEKNRFTKGNKSTIHNNEDYLKQSFIKIQKSIKILEDSKDKGVSINADFIDEILKEKMTHKEDIKKLFDEIYEHLYGKYSATMPEMDKLYKESVSVMVKNQKVVAEKMARFAKRSVQFEGEGLYSGLAVFGDNLETYNQTLIQIMKYLENRKKKTPKNESILLESRYKGVKLNLSKQLAKTIFKELENKYKLMNPKY
jgi:hypothetical protein